MVHKGSVQGWGGNGRQSKKIPEKVFIKRDWIIKLKVSQVRGKDKTRIFELYGVLPGFDK